jgi:hypothetical protein
MRLVGPSALLLAIAASLPRPSVTFFAGERLTKLADDASETQSEPVAEETDPLYRDPEPIVSPPLFDIKVDQGPGGDYPTTFPLTSLIENWNPDDMTLPKNIYNSLRTFDFADPDQLAEATRFRNMEVPFLITNVAAVEEVVKKWNFRYLKKKLKDRDVKVEISKDNHMMYWSHKHMTNGAKKGWTPPTELSTINLQTWLEKAQVPAEKKEGEITHYYFRMDEKGKSETKWIAQDLEGVFPHRKNFFIVDPHGHRGINCRFGMHGIIAEAHYDGSRNMIAMLKG